METEIDGARALSGESSAGSSPSTPAGQEQAAPEEHGHGVPAEPGPSAPAERGQGAPAEHSRTVSSPLAPSVGFTPISDAYGSVLRVRALIRGGTAAIIFAVLAVLLRNSWWLWVCLGLLVVAVGWYGLSMWLSLRRARAIGYVEEEEDLLVCGGLLVRHLEVVPFGRMQQVTVEAGPIMRRFGLATVIMETASASTNATIPGLEVAEAERVRIRLTELGNAMREGL